MTRKPDGGSAYPLNTANLINPGAFDPEPGMSLRDWFAGQALVGIAGPKGEAFGLSEHDSASWAYSYADAMIAARKEE